MPLDVKRSFDAYRARHGELRLLDVPELQYLMVDGHGDPNTSAAYAEALSALYPVAYALKFASRRDLGRDALRLESLAEGRCVQTLHIGGYDDEGPVLAELHDAFLPSHGLRTILRQPVAPLPA